MEETVGKRLEEIKREVGLLDDETITTDYSAQKRNKQTKALREYVLRLNDITVLDPACGSGAFLIQTLEYLLQEHRNVAILNEQLTGTKDILSEEGLIRDILSKNIYGVDINPESVEITKLALWLHTAIPNAPLSNLGSNIKCGNSLVDNHFYERKAELLTGLDLDQQERVNAFDWETEFPQVFEPNNFGGGFDCVVGNPPYVKLQNFKRIDADTTEYLMDATHKDDGNATPRYFSTQTGNFDLYLPFIERGIELLNDKGKLGYIAPNVWLKNQYGNGLKQFIKQRQHLDRWLDYGCYQIFEEATTYTALQFFSKQPNKAVKFAHAPEGGTNAGDWLKPGYQIDYDALPDNQSWDLLTKRERKLFKKIYRQTKTLEEYADKIIVGVQTSADHIYHLQKIGDNLYRHEQRKKGKIISEWEGYLEPDIMLPLVSGQEAKAYETPHTETYILFPYKVSENGARLYTPTEFSTQFPSAWAYLQKFEADLRGRECGKMDHQNWYETIA